MSDEEEILEEDEEEETGIVEDDAYEKEVQQSLELMLGDLLVELDMKDWTVGVKYAPEYDADAVADVTFSIHKEAEITVYEFRPQYARKDLTHELMHCKIGLSKRSMETIITYQQKLIDDLAQGYEEQVVDDLTRMVGRYAGRSQIQEPEQLELFKDEKAD